MRSIGEYLLLGWQGSSVNKGANNQWPKYHGNHVASGAGRAVLALSKTRAHQFASQAAFDEWFSGVYLRTSAGLGSVLRVSSTELAFGILRRWRKRILRRTKRRRNLVPLHSD